MRDWAKTRAARANATKKAFESSIYKRADGARDAQTTTFIDLTTLHDLHDLHDLFAPFLALLVCRNALC